MLFIQIAYGRRRIAIANQRSGCANQRLPQPELRCVHSMSDDSRWQRCLRVLKRRAAALRVPQAAHRPEDARNAIPWCLVAAAGPSPEAGLRFSKDLNMSASFSDL